MLAHIAFQQRDFLHCRLSRNDIHRSERADHYAAFTTNAQRFRRRDYAILFTQCTCRASACTGGTFALMAYGRGADIRCFVNAQTGSETSVNRRLMIDRAAHFASAATNAALRLNVYIGGFHDATLTA